MKESLQRLSKEKEESETHFQKELEKKEQNLGEVSEVKTSLKQQVDELEARLAEEKEAESSLRRDLVRERLKNDELERIQEHNTRGHGSVVLLKNAEIEGLKKDLSDAMQSADQAQRRWMGRIETQKETHQEEMGKLQTVIARLKLDLGESAAQRERLQALRAEEAKAEAIKVEELERALERQANELENLREELEQVKEGGEKRLNRMEAAHKERMSSLQLELEEVTKERDELREGMMEARRSLHSNREESSSTVAAAKAAVDAYRTEADRLREQLAHEREMWKEELEKEEHRRDAAIKSRMKELERVSAMVQSALALLTGSLYLEQLSN